MLTQQNRIDPAIRFDITQALSNLLCELPQTQPIARRMKVGVFDQLVSDCTARLERVQGGLLFRDQNRQMVDCCDTSHVIMMGLESAPEFKALLGPNGKLWGALKTAIEGRVVEVYLRRIGLERNDDASLPPVPAKSCE